MYTNYKKDKSMERFYEIFQIKYIVQMQLTKWFKNYIDPHLPIII